MESINVEGGITVLYPPEEQESAGVIAQACQDSLITIDETWGLKPQAPCRVFVMTSWLSFTFQAAPWYYWPLFTITLPFWFLRVRDLWPKAGGWSQYHRRAPAIGVKPIRLLEQSESEIGQMLFVQDSDMEKKLQHIVCHELTHALSGHLKLPMWLNEGIAMISVDRYFGKQTVRDDSLDALRHRLCDRRLGEYERMSNWSLADYVYHYARSYWMTRLLVEQNPDALKNLLRDKYRTGDAENELANTLGISRFSLWENIDQVVLEHFGDS